MTNTLTTRGTCGKLNASRRGSLYGAVMSYLRPRPCRRVRPFQFPPDLVNGALLDRGTAPVGRNFFDLSRRSTMKFGLLPYSFFENREGHIVVEQKFVFNTPNHIAITRSQAETFIQHLTEFVQRYDADHRRCEVENLLKEIKR